MCVALDLACFLLPELQLLLRQEAGPGAEHSSGRRGKTITLVRVSKQTIAAAQVRRETRSVRNQLFHLRSSSSIEQVQNIVILAHILIAKV